MRALLLGWSALILVGCEASYALKQGWIHIRRLNSGIPIRSFINDPSTPPDERESALLILGSKAFGIDKLGLTRTDDFSSLVKIHEGAVAYLVFACPKDRLEPHLWRFPLVGALPYKGFFSLDDSLKEAKRLDGLGLDTYVTAAAAFSTLGWCRDPVYSTMLKMDRLDLVRTILHEMAHRTVFFPTNPKFNERFATFVGWMGTVEFMKYIHGARSPQAQRAIRALELERRFACLLERAHRMLNSIYQLSIPMEEKMSLRRRAFEEIRGWVMELSAAYSTGAFRGLEEATWNNALFMALWLYRYDATQLEELYNLLDRDLRSLVQTVLFWREEGLDPQEMLPVTMQEGNQAPSRVCLSLLTNHPSGSSK
jgi:predicted aminopeptidase